MTIYAGGTHVTRLFMCNEQIKQCDNILSGHTNDNTIHVHFTTESTVTNHQGEASQLHRTSGETDNLLEDPQND